MAKNDYKCILYEKGDKVISRFGNLFDTKDILEIEDTELKYVGIYPALFLKFVGKPKDITDLANYFLPAPKTETEEKYKNGLVYFNEVKVTTTKEKSKGTSKVHSLFAKQIKARSNELTEEDLKPRVLPAGTFKTKPTETP